jgi:2-oxoglutarate dehydrogenase complex dehydrogenase (E1) component-like enzyme
MYQAIEKRRSVRKLYMESLVNRGDITLEEAERALERFRQRLQQAFDESRDAGKQRPARVERTPPEPAPVRPPLETAVDAGTLEEVLDAITTIPQGFEVHPKLRKWLDDRKAALSRDAVDWSLGEALAFGSLLLDGVMIRLTGQDTRRGTFSQRHSVLVDRGTGAEHVPLQQLGEFHVYDSLLSEYAAMGFEYGYSVANPDALVLWEAQFGDFVNGGQIVVDQFVVAAEDKWSQTSGLVLLLPHGYEGQGPEHSSARLERFLELSAEDNIQVAVPSTPAQYFHLLRRQGLRDLRKPLVVITPKSLLRLPAARSPAADLTAGTFHEVIPDAAWTSSEKKASRLVFCQGKVYYDLLKRREETEGSRVALVRLEQLYPFPADQVREQLERFEGAEPWWVQEEPENMGALRYVDRVFRDRLGVDVPYVAREESASPATGSLTLHQQEQEELLEEALGLS